MIRNYTEDRPLIEWLITQEKVLQLWIDEAVSSASSTSELVESLEKHRVWLSSQIHKLASQPHAI